MKISENLKKLSEKHNLNTLELSRRTGIAQPVIYRLLTGETQDPKITTLLTLSNYFGIALDQLVEEHPLFEPKKKYLCFEIPLLTWKQVSEQFESSKNAVASEKVIIDFKPISNIFALRVDDDSMLPIFTKETLLIINGDQDPIDGNFIIAKIRGNKEALFRQLVIDGKTRYLKSLNPDADKCKIALFDKKKDIFCGVLIQSKTDYT